MTAENFDETEDKPVSSPDWLVRDVKPEFSSGVGLKLLL